MPGCGAGRVGGKTDRPLAEGELQQGKLAGCFHAFTVCTPSKDSSGGPHTPKLMIKHQGQHNVAARDGVYSRGGADDGRGVSAADSPLTVFEERGGLDFLPYDRRLCDS